MSYGGYTGGGYVQTASETPPPAIAPLATTVVQPRAKPAEWAFVVAGVDGAALGDLTEARSRRVTVRLRDSAEAGFSLSGRSSQADTLAELATDLLVYRDRDLVFRGRMGASSDRISPDVHTVTWSAHDYRAMLHRRILYSDLTFSQQDEEVIAWALVGHTQGQTAGDLGVTRKGWLTGTKRDRTYTAGKNIGEALDQLTEVIGGPDYEVGPDLVFRMWPVRGRHQNVVLAFGENVSEVFRDVNPGDYANAVRVTGKGEEDDVTYTTPVVRTAAGLSLKPEGRFDAADGDPDIITQSVLTARADGLIAERSVVRPGYSVTLTPGWWRGPEHMWLGDTVRLQIASGRLRTNTLVRVYELDMAVNDDGGEDITVRLGRPHDRMLPMVPFHQWRHVNSALSDLNRR